MKKVPSPRSQGPARRRSGRSERSQGPAERTTPPDHAISDRRRDLKRAGILVLLSFLVYNANLRPIPAGDTFPARFLPFALWGRGTLTLDSVQDVARVGHLGPRSLPFWMLKSTEGDFTVSSYPLVTPVLVAPLYAPAVAVLHFTGWRRHDLAVAGVVMEKLSASLLAAVSVGLMYLLLRRRLDPRLAALLAAAYAFGTNTWVTSSQALWQHGATQLFALVALLCLTGEGGRWRLVLGGAACGLIPFNRPPDLPLAMAIGVAALLLERRRAWPFVLAAVGAAAPFTILNLHLYGHVGGGYFRIPGYRNFFAGSIPVGVTGLLVSPGKGLFVFSPFLLLLGRRLVRPAPGDRHGVLDACLAAGFVLTLVLLARGDFRGGFSYGARFLTGYLPALLWLLAPAVRRLSPAGIRVFAAAVLVGIAIQAVGAFCYPHGGSDNGDVWSLRDAPFLVEPRAGLASQELLPFRPAR